MKMVKNEVKKRKHKNIYRHKKNIVNKQGEKNISTTLNWLWLKWLKSSIGDFTDVARASKGLVGSLYP